MCGHGRRQSGLGGSCCGLGYYCCSPGLDLPRSMGGCTCLCSPGDMQLTGAWIMGDHIGRWPHGGPGCSISFETNTELGRAFLAHRHPSRHRAKAEKEGRGGLVFLHASPPICLRSNSCSLCKHRRDFFLNPAVFRVETFSPCPSLCPSLSSL